MIEDLLDLPAHVQMRLTQALESGTLAIPCSMVALRSALGAINDADAVLGHPRHGGRILLGQ